MKTAQVHADASAEESGSSHGKRCASFVETFEGNPKVQTPSLYWYADDPYIKQLIRSRSASEGSKTKHYERKIDQASSSTLDVATAAKIDTALDKMGLSANASFKGMAKEEMRKEFSLVIDF